VYVIWISRSTDIEVLGLQCRDVLPLSSRFKESYKTVIHWPLLYMPLRHQESITMLLNVTSQKIPILYIYSSWVVNYCVLTLLLH